MKGLTLLEVVIGLALAVMLLQLFYLWQGQINQFWKARQAEMKSLENALFFLEKFAGEAYSSRSILNVPGRLCDDFNFSFIDSQNRAVTYCLEGNIIKRRLDSVQPLTEDNVILNTRLVPPSPLFIFNGETLEINLALENDSSRPLELASRINFKK